VTHPSPDPDSNPHRLAAVTQVLQALITVVDEAIANTTNRLMAPLHPWLAGITAGVGRVVSPLAHLSWLEPLSLMPGMRWLLAALGQVNVTAVGQEVDRLRRQYPEEGARALAQRVMADTALRAAGIGLATNLAPPAALALTLVDMGAIAALQADMIYRIATLYGYSPQVSDRRGEVLTIWLLSSSASSLIKSGTSVVELLPGLGAALGVATDAALIYSVGYLACRYYETKPRFS
jgi:uncharacterized protein (DUF697 family)